MTKQLLSSSFHKIIMICQYFAVQLFVSVLQRHLFEALLTIVNFLIILFPSLLKPVYILCRRLSSIGFHRVFPLYRGKSRTHFSCNKYYFHL